MEKFGGKDAISQNEKYINLNYIASFDNNLNGFNNIKNQDKRTFQIYNCISFNNQYNFNIYNRMLNVFWKNYRSWNPLRDHHLYSSSNIKLLKKNFYMI